MTFHRLMDEVTKKFSSFLELPPFNDDTINHADSESQGKNQIKKGRYDSVNLSGF